MINASELRLGNLIMVPAFSANSLYESPLAKDFGLCVVAVNEVLIRDSKHYGENWAGEAIPLTLDWLREFGFTYNDLNGDSGFWQKLPLEILESENRFYYNYLTEVKSVHQLQNLYFDLTGKELKPKENAK